MIVKVSSANMDVLASGSVLAFSSTSDVLLEVKISESFSFDLVLKFESNGEKQHVIKPNIDGNIITLTCVNFDNALGTGTATPVELAVFEGKKVYINFWVYSLGQNAARKVSYTIYKEK